MPSGFSIIIAGELFDPKSFIEKEPRSRLPWEIVVPSNEDPRRYSALELYDILPEPFPLDLVTEFFDFLLEHREELSRASNAPGVNSRSLNLYDEPSNLSVEFSFSHDQLRTIVDLGFNLCVEDLGGQNWAAGSRLLYRPEPTTGDLK